MGRTPVCGPDRAYVLHLHFNAFHVDLDGTAIGEDQGGGARWRVRLLERNGEQIEDGVLPGPVDPTHPHGFDMLEMHAGQPPLGRLIEAGLPIEPTDLDGEPALLGQENDIAYPQNSVLQMGRDDGQIFRIEGDEFEEVHGCQIVDGSNLWRKLAETGLASFPVSFDVR